LIAGEPVVGLFAGDVVITPRSTETGFNNVFSI